jgi:hypothetical protein
MAAPQTISPSLVRAFSRVVEGDVAGLASSDDAIGSEVLAMFLPHLLAISRTNPTLAVPVFTAVHSLLEVQHTRKGHTRIHTERDRDLNTMD